MEGIFLRKKFNIWLFFLFICGLFFIGLYIFLNIVDFEATGELLTFLIIGILICLVVIPSWLLNFGAFIRVNEDSIKAKYHWFGKIDCKLSNVNFAAARINTLIIQSNDGKIHTIMGIENAFQLASFIRRNMSFEINEQPETLLKELSILKSVKKNGIIYVILGLAFMFINLFITVFLTGERDLHEFSQVDWVVFSVMGVIEIATVITTFYLASKAGKNNIPIEKMQYAIQRRTIETKALLPGNVIKVFTDANYSFRITVFGYYNENSVYYTVQEFDLDYNLIKVGESELYESIDLLPDGLGELIDITKKVLHQS